jgi:hypothetical protein
MPFAIAADVSAMPITLFETQSRGVAHVLLVDHLEGAEPDHDRRRQDRCAHRMPGEERRSHA